MKLDVRRRKSRDEVVAVIVPISKVDLNLLPSGLRCGLEVLGQYCSQSLAALAGCERRGTHAASACRSCRRFPTAQHSAQIGSKEERTHDVDKNVDLPPRLIQQLHRIPVLPFLDSSSEVSRKRVYTPRRERGVRDGSKGRGGKVRRRGGEGEEVKSKSAVASHRVTARELVEWRGGGARTDPKMDCFDVSMGSPDALSRAGSSLVTRSYLYLLVRFTPR